jgi:hypothetical protein
MRARVRHMRYVYEGNYPKVFAIDVYGDATVDEAGKFVAFDTAMRKEDPSNTLGWRDAALIVAETFYDDPLAAENLRTAIDQTGRNLAFLTQWPLDRGANAPAGGDCSAVNVAPPAAWDVFGAYGF